MGSPSKSMPLTELSDRYKAVEESIRQLAKDSGLSEEQVAKSVTGRFRRDYRPAGSTGGRTAGRSNLKELPKYAQRGARG